MDPARTGDKNHEPTEKTKNIKIFLKYLRK